MTEIMRSLLSFETLAVVLALTYVWLAIRQSIWCWPAAALSASIYAVLFLEGRLLMEAGLQVFYVFMAGYGMWQWRFAGTNAQTLTISSKPLGWHAGFIFGILLVSAMAAWLLATFTQAEAVVLDSLTTIASLAVTWMVAKKLVENWWYWVVIDAVYVYLFASKGYWLTSCLYALFLIMAIYGYKTWRLEMTRMQAQGASK
ncbi:MAG: putative thiamine transporter PnuT [Idiomarinaceae bacterium HL-53]|nr:MAG: putative thiamine transporter PnuT [Idiomarinaceae bacterium HL-53]CUS48143.1 nicotinamide mononucleotide transporter [Idiomarinaceae bacterium HL-53]